jgi:hypothetical protein
MGIKLIYARMNFDRKHKLISLERRKRVLIIKKAV